MLSKGMVIRSRATLIHPVITIYVSSLFSLAAKNTSQQIQANSRRSTSTSNKFSNRNSKLRKQNKKEELNNFLRSNKYGFSDDNKIIEKKPKATHYKRKNQKFHYDKSSNNKNSYSRKSSNNMDDFSSKVSFSNNKNTIKINQQKLGKSSANKSTVSNNQRKPTMFSMDSFINIGHPISSSSPSIHNFSDNKIKSSDTIINNSIEDDILNLDIGNEENEELGVSVWDEEQHLADAQEEKDIKEFHSKSNFERDVPLLVPKNVSYNENIFSKDTDTMVGSPGKFTLRDYQKECILSCLQALDKGKRRIAVSLATGGGKTVIFTNLIKHVKPFDSKQGDKTLVLVHRKELAEQAFQTCQRFMGIDSGSPNPMSIELDLANYKATGGADITVASIQTLSSNERLLKYDPQDFKLIIIDEAHHSAANSYVNILSHFNADKPDTKVAVVGFSATLNRHDGKSLMSSMDHIVYHKGLTEMIKDGWLCDAKFTTVKNEFADLSEVSSYAGDYTTSSLSKVLNSHESNDLILRTYLKYNSQYNFKSTILFGVDVQHVVDLCELFNTNGISSEFVSGKTKKKDREEILQNFKNGNLPVIMNCGVFTEGTDIPNIDCVLLARPTKSKGLLLQMIGRGLRKHESKSHCHIIEFISLRGDLISAPSLVGLPADFNAADASLEDLTKEKEKQDRKAKELLVESFYKKSEKSFPGMKDGKVSFDRFDSFETFLDENRVDSDTQYSKDQEILQNHELPWIRIKNDTWIAGLIGIGYIRIIKHTSNETYSLIFYSSNQRTSRADDLIPTSSSSSDSSKIPYYISAKIDDIPDLDSVLNMISKKYNSHNGSFLSKSFKSADWRFSAATTNQKKLVKRFFENALQKKLYFNYLAHPDFTNKYIDYFNNFSKGMCTDLIFSKKVAGNRLFVMLAEHLLEMYQDKTTKNFFNESEFLETRHNQKVEVYSKRNFHVTSGNGLNVL